MHFEEIKKVLQTKTIGIAGCGGLGSNCAVALARTGVGKLIIADFDVVEESNLNRQYYFHYQIGQKKVDSLKANIKHINPNTQIEAHHLRLDETSIVDTFKDCDVVVEAFDTSEMKLLITEIMADELPHMPLVLGVGMAGWGDSNSIKCRSYKNLYICGDEEKEISDELPPLAPRVGIVANMQANTVLEILLASL